MSMRGILENTEDNVVYHGEDIWITKISVPYCSAMMEMHSSERNACSQLELSVPCKELFHCGSCHHHLFPSHLSYQHCPVPPTSVVFLGALEDSSSAWGFCHKRWSSDFTGFSVWRWGGKCIRIQLQAAVPLAKHGGRGPEPSSAHTGTPALRANGFIFLCCPMTQSWGRISSPYLFHCDDQSWTIFQQNIDAGLQTGILKLFSYTDDFYARNFSL